MLLPVWEINLRACALVIVKQIIRQTASWSVAMPVMLWCLRNGALVCCIDAEYWYTSVLCGSGSSMESLSDLG